MNAREVAEKNKMLEYMVGSKLYGTDTSTSDTDYSGVFMPNADMVFGFERAEEVDLSVKSKRKDGKNDENAVDRVVYELRKFVKLALENNPNILEQLFVNKKNLVFSNEYGNELLRNAYLFPHKGLKEKFLGYAFSQKHKMVIRTDNFHALENANEWLEENVKTVEDSKRLLVEFLLKKLPFMSVKGDNILMGDLNFQRHFMLRKVKKMIVERLSKATNRKDLLTRHGYDTKFASHLVRLMLEGKELLSTGKLEFPLRYAQTILDVKLGKWKMTEVLEYAEELEQNVVDAVELSALPKRPRYNEVQELVKRLLKDFHGVK
jgi:predicted nucleotidyltransferase